jgi:hypothetical protein
MHQGRLPRVGRLFDGVDISSQRFHRGSRRFRVGWAHQLASLFKSGEGSCQIGPENL